VTFKNRSFQDKVESKKHMDFVNKDVFEALKNAKKGEEFTITREKDKDGKYWQWVGITSSESGGSSGGNPSNAASKGTPAPRSTYETPEERAKKQVYIVRQSSISSAIEYLNGTGAIKKSTAQDVLLCAKEFEAYVFGVNENKLGGPESLPPAPEDLDMDVPY
jgi:hypothetical protein